VQLDEPCLVLDLNSHRQAGYKKALTHIGANKHRPQVMLTTEFGALEQNRPLVTDSEIDGLHVDLVQSPKQTGAVLSHLKPKTFLSLGLIDGRNIWHTDLDHAKALARTAANALSRGGLFLAWPRSLLLPASSMGSSRSP
jgi:5-methyltetrahydropteroyltriglutamate--homocysteine methyltransferase